MVRVSEMVQRGLPAAAGIVVGAAAAMLLAGGPARAASRETAAEAARPATTQQDPAVQMQIQQALNNFQVQLQNQLGLMQSRIDTLERQHQAMRFELDDAERDRITGAPPMPSDPIPGVPTYGRLRSESSEAYRFELQAPTGELLGQLGMTAEGPGLVLLDATGQISIALVATPTGAELRMADEEGNLQTVVSGR